MGSEKRLGTAGRVGVAAACLHTALLFFPPIPPDVKGSLWSYLLAAVAVVAGTLEVRSRSPNIVAWWSDLAPRARWTRVLGVTATLLVTGLAMHATLPDLFARWSHEAGVYQPLTMFAYLSAAVVLWATAREATEAHRSGLRIVAAGFVVLFLEEIDYFGIFGGILGRVDGIYVGSLHDVIELLGAGIIPLAAVLAFGAVVLFLPLLAWQLGHLHPVRLLRLVSPSGWAWWGLGAGLMGTAQLMDLGTLSPEAFEEVFEVSGGILWLAAGLDLARRARRHARIERFMARTRDRAYHGGTPHPGRKTRMKRHESSHEPHPPDKGIHPGGWA